MKHSRSLLAIIITATVLWITSSSLFAQDKSEFYTEPYQQKALEIYKKSIAYRTAASHGLVPIFANYLADQFRAGGFPEEDIHILPINIANDEESAALVVRYRGDGSSGAKPILLAAHMDVVDALPEDWERDPFTLIEENGYFFGRGTMDNKNGTTILTSTFLRLKEENFVPSRDLIIAFTGDEETGMVTTQALMTTYRELTDAEFVLNADAGLGEMDEEGEALILDLQAAEKTFATFEITARNPGGHSSTPRPDNAIYELADALGKIESYRFPVRYNDITLRYFELNGKTRSDELGEAMLRFSKNPKDESASDIIHNYPTEVGKTRTTCVATMLRGGHAENALPQSATATVNCRIFPGVEVKDIQSTLAKVVQNNQLEIEIIGSPAGSPASPLRKDVLDAITKTVHSLYPGIPIIPSMSSYGTDGKWYRAAGIPTYGFSGIFMNPNEEFAHGLNERLPVRAFYNALDQWHFLLTEIAGPDK